MSHAAELDALIRSGTEVLGSFFRAASQADVAHVHAVQTIAERMASDLATQAALANSGVPSGAPGPEAVAINEALTAMMAQAVPSADRPPLLASASGLAFLLAMARALRQERILSRAPPELVAFLVQVGSKNVTALRLLLHLGVAAPRS